MHVDFGSDEFVDVFPVGNKALCMKFSSKVIENFHRKKPFSGMVIFCVHLYIPHRTAFICLLWLLFFPEIRDSYVSYLLRTDVF